MKQVMLLGDSIRMQRPGREWPLERLYVEFAAVLASQDACP